MIDPVLDYCTMWWDRITLFGKTYDWSTCCYQHDIAVGELQNMVISGLALMNCVNGVLPIMGVVMFIGVTSPVAAVLLIREWWRKRRQRDAGNTTPP